MTLEEKFVEYCVSMGNPPESDSHFSFKWNARPHFLSGAVAMAEILAGGLAPLTEELKNIRKELQESMFADGTSKVP